MEKQRYQVTQDNQEYILSTYLMGDKINIECQMIFLGVSFICIKSYNLLI